MSTSASVQSPSFLLGLGRYALALGCREVLLEFLLAFGDGTFFALGRLIDRRQGGLLVARRWLFVEICFLLP